MFRLWVTFTNGQRHMEIDWARIESNNTRFHSAINRLIHGPGSFVVDKLMIVDGGDCSVWEWAKDHPHNSGVVHSAFPSSWGLPGDLTASED